MNTEAEDDFDDWLGALDRDYRAYGYTHFTIAWIHGGPKFGGDDYPFRTFSNGALTEAQIHEEIRNEGGCVFDDFEQKELP